MKFLLSIIFITSFVVCEKGFSSTEASEIDSMKDNPLNIDHRRATRTEISSTASEKDIGDDEYPPAMQKSFAYDPQEEESKRKEAEQKRMRDSIRRQKKHLRFIQVSLPILIQGQHLLELRLLLA